MTTKSVPLPHIGTLTHASLAIITTGGSAPVFGAIHLAATDASDRGAGLKHGWMSRSASNMSPPVVWDGEIELMRNVLLRARVRNDTVGAVTMKMAWSLRGAV